MRIEVGHESEIGTFLEKISPYLGAHFYKSEARVANRNCKQFLLKYGELDTEELSISGESCAKNIDFQKSSEPL
jgi:hypothetical protein